MVELTNNRNLGETIARFYRRELFTCKRKEVLLDEVEWDHTGLEGYRLRVWFGISSICPTSEAQRVRAGVSSRTDWELFTGVSLATVAWKCPRGW